MPAEPVLVREGEETAGATMNTACEVCGDFGYEKLLLCCSACKNEHCVLETSCRDCLEFLYGEPEEWFCDECDQRRNEGSYSRSLGKASTEMPSKHAQFDSISQQPITTGINFAAPAPPQSPATGITQDLGSTGRNALAPIICQDFRSACNLEVETGALALCLPSHVQSKVVAQNQPAQGHDTAIAAPIRTVEKMLPILEKDLVITHNRLPQEHDPPMGSDGRGRHTSHEQGKRLHESPDLDWQCADSPRGDTKTSVGSSEKNKELTFEQVSRHFSMPIEQAAQEMNMGLTVLKKQCRKLGIMRWPQRKLNSLQKLIDDVEALGKDGHVSRSLVGSMQRTMKLLGDDEAEGLRQMCFNQNNAQEDGHLTRSVVEYLQLKKKMIEERPDMTLDHGTKDLRQVCFKERFKRKQAHDKIPEGLPMTLATTSSGTSLLEATLVEQVVATEAEDEAPTQMLALQKKLHDHTVDLGSTGRNALAPIICQDFRSACNLEAETGALAQCLPSHVQSKMLPILEKDLMGLTEKATQNDALKAKMVKNFDPQRLLELSNSWASVRNEFFSFENQFQIFARDHPSFVGFREIEDQLHEINRMEEEKTSVEAELLKERQSHEQVVHTLRAQIGQYEQNESEAAWSAELMKTKHQAES